MINRQFWTLEGGRALSANLAALGEEIATRSGQQAVRRGAVVIRNAVVQAAPVGDDNTSRTYRIAGGNQTRTVDYGHLRDNIRVQKGQHRKAHTVVSLVTTGKAFWGRILETGSIKMAAQPWFKPALDNAASAALAAMVNTLEKSIARAIKKAGQ